MCRARWQSEVVIPSSCFCKLEPEVRGLVFQDACGVGRFPGAVVGRAAGSDALGLQDSLCRMCRLGPRYTRGWENRAQTASVQGSAARTARRRQAPSVPAAAFLTLVMTARLLQSLCTLLVQVTEALSRGPEAPGCLRPPRLAPHRGPPRATSASPGVC